MVLIKSYFLSGSGVSRPIAGGGGATIESAPPHPSIGTNLKSQLLGVDWNGNGQTVLLALSTHCHYCSDSAPFFRQLAEKSGKTYKILAVLPESVTEAQDYLKLKGVHVDQLRQMSLDKVGVAGTPTMLLVDKSGAVTDFWVGMLSPEAQGDAMKAIARASQKGKTEL